MEELQACKLASLSALGPYTGPKFVVRTYMHPIAEEVPSLGILGQYMQQFARVCLSQALCAAADVTSLAKLFNSDRTDQNTYS